MEYHASTNIFKGWIEKFSLKKHNFKRKYLVSMHLRLIYKKKLTSIRISIKFKIQIPLELVVRNPTENPVFDVTKYKGWREIKDTSVSPVLVFTLRQIVKRYQ